MRKIGISIGDINGIGPEVIIKALSDKRVYQNFIPIIYGSSKIMSYHKNVLKNSNVHFYHINSIQNVKKDKINVLNCWEENVSIDIGQITKEGGQYAFTALDKAVFDLKEGNIDALVTAPIHKNAMKMADFPYLGHTDFIANKVNGKAIMMMVSDKLKVALMTTHIPLSEVSQKITKSLVMEKLNSLNQTLKIDFGIERPRIAVLGLNPHAGDGGIIGEEEEKTLIPALIETKKQGIMCFGPYAADSFFGAGNYKKYDAILAMYHDQGLTPFKTISFEDGVNYSSNLSVVRTSPDHGTAFDIAGKGVADATSMREAIYLANDIANKRNEFKEITENPLRKKAKPTSEGDEDEEILE